MLEKTLNLDVVFNSLSMGQITYGVVNELFNSDVKTCIFPKNQQIDLAAYNLDDNFKQKINYSLNEATKNYSRDNPGLSIWHINGSWNKPAKSNYLLTFHELDQITDNERAILNSFDKVFVTSKFSKEVFQDGGVTVPVIFTPMGIEDTQYKKLNKKYYDENVTCWALAGKIENKRKRTKDAIRGWVKVFGGNPSHRLHLLVHNPFFSPEQMNQVYAEVFNNQPPPSNVLIYPYQQTNALVNDFFNCTDIVIDMSGGEALSLPSLNMVSIGKHAIIHNCSAMSDWATKENAVLIDSTGKEPVYDNVFFHQGHPYNQGNIFTWSEPDYLKGLEEVLQRSKANKVNKEGLKLRESYHYKVGVEVILKEIFG